MIVTRLERGWAGHFIMGSRCRFRRNTLLEANGQQLIVSTVGALYINEDDRKPTTIGWNRYYETMTFLAKLDGLYIDIDVTRQVSFEAECAIDHIDTNKVQGVDNEANNMHEAVVSEFIARMEAGEVLIAMGE